MRLSNLSICLLALTLAACGTEEEEPLDTATEPTGDTATEDTAVEEAELPVQEAKSSIDFETLPQVDVGHREPAGESWVDGDSLVMMSQTGDIWGNTDEGEVDNFRFGHLLYDNDVTAEVVLESIEFAEGMAKAGLMMRQDSRDPGSSNVALLYTPASGVVMQWRDMGTTVAVQANDEVPLDTPIRLRLIREDIATFIGEYSTDGGEDWEEVGRVVLESWGTQAYVGVVVSSYQLGAYAQASFRELSIQGDALLAP